MTSPCPRRWLCPGPFVEQRVCWEAPGAWPGVYKWDAFQPPWFGSHRRNLLEVETRRFSRVAYNSCVTVHSEGSFLSQDWSPINVTQKVSEPTYYAPQRPKTRRSSFPAGLMAAILAVGLSQSFPTFLWGAADFFFLQLLQVKDRVRTVTVQGHGTAIDDPTGLIRTQRIERRQIYFISFKILFVYCVHAFLTWKIGKTVKSSSCLKVGGG